MTTPENKKWRVVISRQPAKMLRRRPQNIGKRIDHAVLALTHDPRPPGCKQLTGYRHFYRIRVGDWRVIYMIRDEELLILIVRIATRGGAYRSLP